MIQQRTPKTAKGKVLPIPETFVSAGHLFEGLISLVDDEANTSNADRFVFKKVMGQKLNNWTSMEVPQVMVMKE